MEYNYPNNTKDCNVTYMRTKSGPNHFRVYYKNAAQIRYTALEVGRVFGIAKFTPSVNEIRNWCKEMIQTHESQPSLNDGTDTTVGEP